MRDSKENTEKRKSEIQCLEVLIPKSVTAGSSHNLRRTLTVYSLENRPVQLNRSIHRSEIFHFMVYDWKRTIKQLLDDHQIDYSITKYFSAETIYTDATHAAPMKDIGAFASSDKEAHERTVQMFSGDARESTQLVLDEKIY